LIISHEYKFIFFAVGKTGTHSIESALKRYADPFEMSREEEIFFHEHIPPVFLREKLDDEIWNSYFKFAFVRNTWDMVISDLLWNGLIDSDMDRISVQDVHSLYENQKQYRRGITWSESREQYSFLSDKGGKLLVDYVGRFEKIQADFDEVCARIGIAREQLPILNRQIHKPYIEYYTVEAVNAVAQLWYKDIEKFGFKF
jgi:hypothetical protein